MFGKLARFLLAVYELAVDGDLEHAAGALGQSDVIGAVDIRLDLVRQTGGPVVVASRTAEFDVDLHGFVRSFLITHDLDTAGLVFSLARAACGLAHTLV